MQFIEFTIGKQRISIVASHIQAIKEAAPEHNGKTLVILPRLNDETEEYFIVDETYREAQMMIINCEL